MIDRELFMMDKKCCTKTLYMTAGKLSLIGSSSGNRSTCRSTFKLTFRLNAVSMCNRPIVNCKLQTLHVFPRFPLFSARTTIFQCVQRFVSITLFNLCRGEKPCLWTTVSYNNRFNANIIMLFYFIKENHLLLPKYC